MLILFLFVNNIKLTHINIYLYVYLTIILLLLGDKMETINKEQIIEIASHLGNEWMSDINYSSDRVVTLFNRLKDIKLVFVIAKDIKRFEIDLFVISSDLKVDYSFIKHIFLSRTKQSKLIARDIQNRLLKNVDSIIDINQKNRSINLTSRLEKIALDQNLHNVLPYVSHSDEYNQYYFNSYKFCNNNFSFAHVNGDRFDIKFSIKTGDVIRILTVLNDIL